MTRRRAAPADIDFLQQRVAAGSITLPTHWSPEQAVAVFKILDELRKRAWVHYGLQIQQMLCGQQRTTAHDVADDIDEADVPF